MLNQAIMMGRLCADPELRKTQSEISVCSIRIAVDRDYGKGEQKETDFFDVVAWRGTAEFICKYFTKGRVIVVVGRMQKRPGPIKTAISARLRSWWRTTPILATASPIPAAMGPRPEMRMTIPIWTLSPMENTRTLCPAVCPEILRRISKRPENVRRKRRGPLLPAVSLCPRTGQ